MKTKMKHWVWKKTEEAVLLRLEEGLRQPEAEIDDDEVHFSLFEAARLEERRLDW